ncbi:hypothetical protein [Haloarcula salinisoli]|uniref:DUF3784 domain-containing protein n=1 Tax=Haloarcula salinisoli TaxID=2487746 RepID=A0A8J7YGI6_9EURY|nr:hypothetical protein [Halomicroarcula salinisoli]MBX0286197.1 hypothetical protein [Halomicroarcula salinisoli]MBX0302314.1 hypothetical protein [Halomicroarcula salinisoli]
MGQLTAESLFLVAVMTVTGLFLVWLGRYIRRTEDLSLVAGARGATVTDAAALTTLVGRVTTATGVLTVLVGLVDPLVGSPERGLLWGGYIVLALALAGWAHWRSREFTE